MRSSRQWGLSPSNDVSSEAERAITQRLMDEINQFNFNATGIREFRELLKVDTDADGEVIGGVYGWCSGGSCWVEALWVRDDARRRGLGSRLLDEPVAEAHAYGCHQIALETHTFQAPTLLRAEGI